MNNALKVLTNNSDPKHTIHRTKYLQLRQNKDDSQEECEVEEVEKQIFFSIGASSLCRI